MERATFVSATETIETSDLPPVDAAPRGGRSAKPGSVGRHCCRKGGIVFEEWERSMLQKALEKADGNVAEAARLLGMTYRTFQYRAQKFGMIEKGPAAGNRPLEELTFWSWLFTIWSFRTAAPRCRHQNRLHVICCH